MKIFLIVIGVMISVLLGLFLFSPQPKCKEYGHIESFIQAVGHKVGTTYIYKLDNGDIFEAQHIHNRQDLICEYGEHCLDSDLCD